MGYLLILSFLAIMVGVVVTFAVMKQTGRNKTAVLSGLGLYVVLQFGVAIITCISVVSASTVGIPTTLGHVGDEVLLEGPHLVSPVTSVHSISLGLQVVSAKGAQAASADMQSVHTDLTVNYRVDVSKARALYILNPSLNYEEDYVQPAVFEVFKAVASKYTAEQLVTQRQQMSQDIHAALTQKLKPYGLVVQDINVTNFQFSKGFDDAIEAKVTASQRAEQAKRDLERVQIEAQQAIAKAKGEAEAVAIQAQAVKVNGGAEYLQLQAIQRWNGQLPTYMGAGAPMPFLKFDNTSKQ